MDMWDKLPRQQDVKNRNPSFSSTLLDAIYRSIDEPNGGKGQEELVFYRGTGGANGSLKGSEMNSLQRAVMIEKWMETKVSCDKSRRKSTADSERNYRTRGFDDPMLLNSSSSSSDSSSGARFSSSESDSFYRSKSSHYTTHRPKPIRTSVETSFHGHGYVSASCATTTTQQKPKHEGGFVRTKSKALKIYGELKKAKHPISPGGRLATFLNSLFSTAGNAKKAKISGYDARKTKSEQPATSTTTTTCSSASSFSRSCMSKTPSSRGNGTKRSVRFCLEDDQSQTSIRKPINKELEWRIVEENRRVMEAAKDLLKNYHKKKEEYDHMRDISKIENYHIHDDDEDDAASYASSDLFELDNLSAIGIERYRQELPVYETTRLDTNRAIANGLIV